MEAQTSHPIDESPRKEGTYNAPMSRLGEKETGVTKRGKPSRENQKKEAIDAR
jgi:hypothetical protein